MTPELRSTDFNSKEGITRILNEVCCIGGTADEIITRFGKLFSDLPNKTMISGKLSDKAAYVWQYVEINDEKRSDLKLLLQDESFTEAYYQILLREISIYRNSYIVFQNISRN